MCGGGSHALNWGGSQQSAAASPRPLARRVKSSCQGHRAMVSSAFSFRPRGMQATYWALSGRHQAKRSTGSRWRMPTASHLRRLAFLGRRGRWHLVAEAEPAGAVPNHLVRSLLNLNQTPLPTRLQTLNRHDACAHSPPPRPRRRRPRPGGGQDALQHQSQEEQAPANPARPTECVKSTDACMRR